MRGPTSNAIGALLYYMGTGHAQMGEIKAGSGKLSGRSVHSYGAMSQNREKRALPECPGSVRGIGKTGGAHICRTSYTTSQGCRSRQPERNGVTHTALGAVPISAAGKEFPAFTGSRMTRGQSAGWHPGMGWRRMNMEFITWTVWR